MDTYGGYHSVVALRKRIYLMVITPLLHKEKTVF